MIRLVLADLVTHTRIWIGVLMVAITSGGIAAIGAGLIETGNYYGGDVQYDLTGASTILILFSTATALIVLTSTANLTVTLQQRSYALWQLVGLSPVAVAIIVLAQLAIVGSFGSLLGWVAVKIFSSSIFPWLWGPLESTSGISVHMSGWGLAVIVTAQAVVVMLGGLNGARRASRTLPIEALSSADSSKVSFGWPKGLLLLALVVAATNFSLNLVRADFDTIARDAVLLVPLLAVVIVVSGPIVYRPVLKAWTYLIPTRWSATWYLARNSAEYRLGQSSASITPLMIAISLVGGLFTTTASINTALGQERELSTGDGVILMLGGPLLLSGVGAMATVFMSGYAREREFALIRAAGSTPGTILLTAVWEAVIYTVTAAILATAAILVGAGVLALALDLNRPVVSFSNAAAVGLGGFILLLAATLIPTLISLQADIPGQLTTE